MSASNPEGFCKALSSIAEIMRTHRRFYIGTHVRPDGDATGSVVGVYHALKALGADAVAILPPDVPGIYQFMLEGVERTWQPQPPHPEVMIVVDCGKKERIGSPDGLIKDIPILINIDHHADNSRFGTHNWVDREAAAVGEMIVELYHELNLPLLSLPGQALYAAILTDTGSFNYSMTTAKTHRISAELIELGIDPADIYRRVYQSFPISYMKLRCRALQTLCRAFDGKVSWMRVTAEMLRESGARYEDSDDLANLALSIDDTLVAFLLKEEAPNTVKVNLRSKESADISGVARIFGGGGHPQAAGCTIEAPLDQAEQRLLEALGRELKFGEFRVEQMVCNQLPPSI